MNSTELLRMRIRTKQMLRNKYYNLFANNYNFKELNYQQNDYIKKKLYDEGCIACFEIKNASKLFTDPKNQYDRLCFVPFAIQYYNNYNYPISVLLINERGVPFIPTDRIFNVDEDVVIGYVRRTSDGVSRDVNWYIDRITDLEMLINLQGILHKTPYIIPTNEDNKDRIREFMHTLIESDEPQLFCEFDEVNLFKAITNGATFIMDKLYMMKQNYENELLTFLGIDNLGGSQKKEHLITSEVDSNNMLIKDSCDVYVDVMREFCERVSDLFGLPLTLECKSEAYLEANNEKNTTSEDEGNEELDQKIEEGK